MQWKFSFTPLKYSKGLKQIWHFQCSRVNQKAVFVFCWFCNHTQELSHSIDNVARYYQFKSGSSNMFYNTSQPARRRRTNGKIIHVNFSWFGKAQIAERVKSQKCLKFIDQLDLGMSRMGFSSFASCVQQGNQQKSFAAHVNRFHTRKKVVSKSTSHEYLKNVCLVFCTLCALAHTYELLCFTISF